jgi:glycosyltransferase involved in cell wall biosynthesis
MKILLINMARSLLADEKASASDDILRMKQYAAKTDGLYILVHSLKKHNISTYQEYPKLKIFGTNAPGRISSFFKLYTQAKKLIKDNNIEVVQTQDILLTGLIGLFLKRRLKIKLITCMFGSNVYNKFWQKESLFNKVLAGLGKFILKRTDKILLDGKQDKELLISRGVPENNICLKPIIPNDLIDFAKNKLDQNELSKIKSELGLTAKDTVLLFIGRLARQKNIPGLFRIFKEILQETSNKNIKLLLVGEGTLEKELQALALKLNISNNIIFHKFIPRAKVPYYFGLSNIFVLFSNYEGFARVLMEAGYFGLPVVTTDVSGAQDVISSGHSGFISPVGDQKAFKENLLKLLREQGLLAKFSENVASYTRNNFDYEQTNQLQVDIWNKLR